MPYEWNLQQVLSFICWFFKEIVREQYRKLRKWFESSFWNQPFNEIVQKKLALTKKLIKKRFFSGMNEDDFFFLFTGLLFVFSAILNAWLVFFSGTKIVSPSQRLLLKVWWLKVLWFFSPPFFLFCLGVFLIVLARKPRKQVIS